MPSDALTRDAIVSALDDLGEREHLSQAWLAEDAEEPYPPDAVRQRSRRLRWQVRGRRASSVFISLLILVTGGMGVQGWPIPDALFSFLVGLGIALLGVSMFTVLPGKQIRALQLYDLLKQLDGEAEIA